MDKWETVFDSSSGDTATAAEIIDEFVGSKWEIKFFLKEVPRNSFRSMIQKSVEDRPLMEGYVFNDSEVDLLWGLYQEYPERKHSIKTEKAFQQIRQYMLNQAAQQFAEPSMVKKSTAYFVILVTIPRRIFYTINNIKLGHIVS